MLSLSFYIHVTRIGVCSDLPHRDMLVKGTKVRDLILVKLKYNVSRMGNTL